VHALAAGGYRLPVSTRERERGREGRRGSGVWGEREETGSRREGEQRARGKEMTAPVALMHQ